MQLADQCWPMTDIETQQAPSMKQSASMHIDREDQHYLIHEISPVRMTGIYFL